MSMDNEFTLVTQNKGRLKYLLITLAPPVAIEYLLSYLIKSGVFGENIRSKAPIILAVVVSLLVLIIGYFMIFRKNHVIAVKGTVITDHFTFFNKTNTIHISEVKSVKYNLLGEIVLKGADGKTLLTVEKGMTNYDMFEEWFTPFRD